MARGVCTRESTALSRRGVRRAGDEGSTRVQCAADAPAAAVACGAPAALDRNSAPRSPGMRSWLDEVRLSCSGSAGGCSVPSSAQAHAVVPCRYLRGTHHSTPAFGAIYHLTQASTSVDAALGMARRPRHTQAAQADAQKRSDTPGRTGASAQPASCHAPSRVWPDQLPPPSAASAPHAWSLGLPRLAHGLPCACLGLLSVVSSQGPSGFAMLRSSSEMGGASWRGSSCAAKRDRKHALCSAHAAPPGATCGFWPFDGPCGRCDWCGGAVRPWRLSASRALLRGSAASKPCAAHVSGRGPCSVRV